MAANLIQRLSGGGSNTTPGSSLGGAKSTQSGAILTDNAANNLWRDATNAERVAGLVIYRCWYAENNGDQPATSTVVWVDDQGAGVSGSNIDISLDAAAVGSDTSQTLANETTAPTGQTFSRPSSKGTGLAIGTIPVGSKKAIWERWTVTAGASPGADVPSVTVEGDSAP